MNINLKGLIESLQRLLVQLQALLKQKSSKKGFEAFALAMRKRESSNRYGIVNAYGYLGAYQFGMARLYDLGYTERKAGMTGLSNSVFQWKVGYSREYFLSHPDFQDKIFKEHTRNLIKQINSKFSAYLDKTINGMKITLSGCVAGAHIGGIQGVANLLVNSYDSQDQLGTSISDYVKQFAGYDLNSDGLTTCISFFFPPNV